MTEEEVRAASADWKAGFKAGWVESAMSAVSLDDMPESVRLEKAAYHRARAERCLRLWSGEERVGTVKLLIREG